METEGGDDDGREDAAKRKGKQATVEVDLETGERITGHNGGGKKGQTGTHRNSDGVEGDATDLGREEDGIGGGGWQTLSRRRSNNGADQQRRGGGMERNRKWKEKDGLTTNKGMWNYKLGMGPHKQLQFQRKWGRERELIG